MSVDASEVAELAHGMGLIPGKLARKVKPIMARAGISTKQRLRRDLLGSPHFKQLAASVDYDVREFGFAGDGVIEVEVGVNMERGSAPGLNHIAYFGGSNGGGATVPDPVVAMRQEEPVLLGFLEMAAEGLL